MVSGSGLGGNRGLYLPPPVGPRYEPARKAEFRTPLPDLTLLGSPYLAGILDAADERMPLLETARGCVLKCKFCYDPKSYDKQYYLAADQVRAVLRHDCNSTRLMASTVSGNSIWIPRPEMTRHMRIARHKHLRSGSHRAALIGTPTEPRSAFAEF